MATNRSTSRNARETEDLEKVRDLLLGAELKETEDRIARAERELRREIKAARAESARDIRELGRALRKELEDLAAWIEGESQERTDGEEAQLARIESAKKSLRGRIDKLDGESKQRARGVRDRVSASSRKLRQEAQASEARILETIRSEVEALYAHGMPKQRLSTLLAELADQVRKSEPD